MRGFQDTTPRFDDKKYLDRLTDLYKFPPNEWAKVRLIGPISSFAELWIKIRTKTGKIVPIQKICLDYNPEIDSFDKNICPYRRADLYVQKVYLVNAIIREFQESEPRKKVNLLPEEKKLRKPVIFDDYQAPLKTVGSKSWTPVRVLRIPAGLAGKLKNLIDLNKRKQKDGTIKKYELSHPVFGLDLSIYFDPNEKGPAMYQVQKEESTKLSEAEKKYLLYKLDVMKPEKKDVADKEWSRLKDQLVTGDDEEKDQPKKSKYFSGDDEPKKKSHFGKSKVKTISAKTLDHPRKK